MTQIKLNYILFKVTVRDLRDAFERTASDWSGLTHAEKNRLVGVAIDGIHQWADIGALDDFPNSPAELRDVLDSAISQWREEAAS